MLVEPTAPLEERLALIAPIEERLALILALIAPIEAPIEARLALIAPLEERLALIAPSEERLALIEERLALIAEFVNENEDAFSDPLSKAQEADIKSNPIWYNKYDTSGMKHFKKSKIYSDYTQLLPKITEQKSCSSSHERQESYLYLLNNRRLIALGGDPLTPEKEGGLSLAFIFENIHNSGLSSKTPRFFHCNDNGRVMSNVFKRVWRIVNKYDY